MTIEKIPDRYNLLINSYPLLVIAINKNSLPLKGIAGILDWWLCGDITLLIKNGKFNCNFMETTLLVTNRIKKNKMFLLFGMGENNFGNELFLSKFIEELKKRLTNLKAKNVALLLPDLSRDGRHFFEKNMRGYGVEIYL